MAIVVGQMRSAKIPGLALGIARHGRVLSAEGHGFANLEARRQVTPDSMFHVASVSKTVTATAIMMLVEAGRLGLDDAIDDHLDFVVRNPVHPATPITLRHLLMHISSISDDTYYEVDFRTPNADSTLPLRTFLKDYLAPGGSHYSAEGSYSSSAPGAVYGYSNVAYGLLGHIGGRAAGEDFRGFIRKHLFDRLRMRRTSWTLGEVPAPLRVTPYEETEGRFASVAPVGFPDWSAGMLRISIRSLMPFVAASANGGVVGGTRMLGAASMANMLDMHRPVGLPTWLSGQGLAWMESPDGGTRHINHWGGDPGVFTAIYIDPVTTTGLAVLMNGSATDATKAALKTIVRAVLDTEAAHE